MPRNVNLRRGAGFALTRAKLQLTQQQLAEKLGVSRSLIYMAERGARRLPLRALMQLGQLETIHAMGSVTPTAKGKSKRAYPGRNINQVASMIAGVPF